MIYKCASGLCAISMAVLGGGPVSASSVQQAPTGVTDDRVPEGLIVVRVLPAREATAPEESNAPRPITDRRDPQYVRCRLEPVAGSILKKRKICMTNHEWKLAIRKGNQYAREFVDDNQPGFMLQ